jgi:malate synthase
VNNSWRAFSTAPIVSDNIKTVRPRRALFYGKNCYCFCKYLKAITYFMQKKNIVPGSDERKIHKSISVGADCVVYDLEDSVSSNKKGSARHMVIDALEVITY